MGTRTAAARAEVVAAREALAGEAVRLEAAGRAAVDIPARIRREPAKVAGAAGGAAFLLLGGPGRVLRGARRAIFGRDADLPKSMLPKEVENTIKKLGSDGDKVRATLEREFADYLDEKGPQRKERDLAAVAAGLLGGMLRPVTIRAGKQLAQRLLDPDGPTFNEALNRIRARDGATRPGPASSAASTPPRADASVASAPPRSGTAGDTEPA